MKEVTLNRMILTNFKGVKDRSINLKPDVTRIFGDNETGKTTLFDAFTWCLFGKDSTGKSDSNFSIKTLDKDNNVIPKIDHVVELELSVNGEPVTLTRTYRENWVKKRGREETEFAGHKTTYEWNEVPLKKAEYEAKIRNIVDESVFKLITDPHVFYNLHWEEQRKLLIEICGDVQDNDVAQDDDRFAAILDQLTKKTLKEYQDQMASKRRTINDELKMIPTRIDEVNRGIPNPLPDFDSLKKEKTAIEIEIEGLEKSIQNASAYDETEEARIEQIKKEILYLEAEYDDIKHIIKQRIQAKRSKLEDQYYEYKKKAENATITAYETESEIQKIAAEKARAEWFIKTAKKNLAELRKEFNTTSKLKFVMNANDTICPTCKRDLPKIEEKKDRLEKNFNAEKAKKLEELNKRGAKLKKDTELQTENLAQKSKLLENLKGLLVSQEKERDRLKIEAKTYMDIYEGFDSRLEVEKLVHKDKGVEKIDAQVAVLKESLANRPEADLSEYTYQISEKKQRLNEIVGELALDDVLNKRKQRIQELKNSEKIKAQEMALIEREQFLLDDFVSKKTTMLQEKVNSKFSLVNFKMFEIQINGGLAPTCKAIFKGVDIADVNNAGQIQAGIDIIKTLCDHYGVYAPIFIDNAESITNIPETKSQQIHLIVSEEHPKLTIL